MVEWVSDWVGGWVGGWVGEWVFVWVSGCVGEWVSGWVCGLVGEGVRQNYNLRLGVYIASTQKLHLYNTVISVLLE